MSIPPPPLSPSLEPPRKSVELEDPGAHELESDDEPEAFEDAQEEGSSDVQIPITRVERVDDEPSHGDVPGTAAHSIRTQDAKPDVLTIVPEKVTGKKYPFQEEPPTSPSIPTMVVDKLDPSSPSHGEVPGTAAYRKRSMDAVPDIIRPSSGSRSRSRSPDDGKSPSTSVPVPRTVVTRVDSSPAHGEIPGTEAYNIRSQDAEPDVIERKPDLPNPHILDE